MTLQQVAAAANIDTSTLSRLESGRRRLAIDHLPGLASALGVTVDDLLAPVVTPDPRIRREPVERWGLTMWPLTNRGTSGGLQAFRFLVHADRDTPPEELPVHEGHDWMFVLAGRLRLVLGEDDLVIDPGEAVEFSTLTPHWFGVVEEPVELIAILSAEGRECHLQH